MLRSAEPKDSKNYSDWLLAAKDINLLDCKVFDYPTANTLVVGDRDGEPLLMNTFQAVIVMEALAPKPGLSPLREARALKELFEGIKKIAAATGVREVMFGCKDERLMKFIEGRGFERLSFPVFRYKV